MDSPFFRPEFVQEVAGVRNDVEVAVLDLQGKPVGFFPFQRGIFNTGHPVGGILSDFQGVVVQSNIAWHAVELVRACRLRAWTFDHVLASQDPFAVHQSALSFSPYIDLSLGFYSYSTARRRAGSEQLLQVARKMRKFEREIGQLSFKFHTTDSEVLESLIKWKVDQYRRTNAVNVLAQPWVLPLLRHILERRDEALSGILSALHISDRIVAVHLGMRSFGILHWWFPAYDPAFGRYSPGLILLTEIAKSAVDLGIKRIDLGKGREGYKRSFMSGAISLYEGSVGGSWPVRAALQRWWWVKSQGRRLRRSLIPAHGSSDPSI